MQAAWSPDGTRIAYAGGAVGAADLGICVMDADGSSAHIIARGPGSYEWPAWSPDSKRIAFFIKARLNGKVDSTIAVVNVDGSELRPITAHQGVQRDETPSWSPDGMHIAFQTDRLGAGFRIAVVNRDGTGLKVLARY